MASRGAVLYMTTPFKEGWSSHGGHHRYQQLKELILDAGLPLAGEVAAPQRRELSPASTLQTLLSGLSHLPSARPGRLPTPAGLFRIGAAAHAIRGLKPSDLFLWAPSYGAHAMLGRLARGNGVRVVALIHNIESLVPDQPCPIRPSLRDWHDLELAWLEDADVIFCHSRWDQWYLRLRGLDARPLPYFPARPRYESLLGFRQRRRIEQRRERIVVLGNAHNPPTWRGMLEQLEIIRRHDDLLKDVEFHFCGARTEDLRPHAVTPNVQVHGYVDETVLSDQLAQAKAVWFHQPATTGVVTRIVDMLTAGVPVLANAFAARAQETLSGVHSYDLDDAVPGLIRSDLPVPDLPERPDHFSRDFVETVAELLSGTFDSGRIGSRAGAAATSRGRNRSPRGPAARAGPRQGPRS